MHLKSQQQRLRLLILVQKLEGTKDKLTAATIVIGILREKGVCSEFTIHDQYIHFTLE